MNTGRVPEQRIAYGSNMLKPSPNPRHYGLHNDDDDDDMQT